MLQSSPPCSFRPFQLQRLKHERKRRLFSGLFQAPRHAVMCRDRLLSLFFLLWEHAQATYSPISSEIFLRSSMRRKQLQRAVLVRVLLQRYQKSNIKLTIFKSLLNPNPKQYQCDTKPSTLWRLLLLLLLLNGSFFY